MMKPSDKDAPREHPSTRYLFSKLLPAPPDLFPGTPNSGVSPAVPLILDREEDGSRGREGDPFTLR